ncbi:PH domain-containing protein [Streptomyces sp. TRM66268-LWL]|uniref:PH domain-containing protein n=1 Tax=Streptomyces polyasparticus TaxID=2767826 RepID=A0ABR7SQU1_9ACTN|nr:PH domain-containing protein [Streptomyces polyasparticus]MBC9717753.1 PH domain-containing protein [Streptomyces polyasparticus]
MSSPDESENPRPEPAVNGAPAEPASPDRVFRSGAGIAGGVLLLALGAWLGGDALLRGNGMAPWLALAAMIALVPLVVAYTVRPAVYANDQRLKIRNPFRTIVLPWASVDDVRASFSCEVLSGTEKYQVWAIPVSLRARKSANRRQARAAASDPSGRTSALAGADKPTRAAADQAVDDLRALAERHASDPAAQGPVEVRWAYEVLAPVVAGAILLAVLALVA